MIASCSSLLCFTERPQFSGKWCGHVIRMNMKVWCLHQPVMEFLHILSKTYKACNKEGVIVLTWLLGQNMRPSQGTNWPSSFFSSSSCFVHALLHSSSSSLSLVPYLSVFHTPFSFTSSFYPHSVSGDLPSPLPPLGPNKGSFFLFLACLKYLPPLYWPGSLSFSFLSRYPLCCWPGSTWSVSISPLLLHV